MPRPTAPCSHASLPPSGYRRFVCLSVVRRILVGASQATRVSLPQVILFIFAATSCRRLLPLSRDHPLALSARLGRDDTNKRGAKVSGALLLAHLARGIGSPPRAAHDDGSWIRCLLAGKSAVSPPGMTDDPLWTLTRPPISLQVSWAANRLPSTSSTWTNTRSNTFPSSCQIDLYSTGTSVRGCSFAVVSHADEILGSQRMAKFQQALPC